ncbi:MULTISPECIES: MerR family transcriptional regulator [Cytobacillus]|uniref:MerR family transcriptional regulator n=1 Tax=Cytobacillus pseudoceanisediminis TaxID=3051614 RepID=A0ABZ2ZQ43_9BACI|nr:MULTISPECIES: MerR family transcriptional regulator [Cytobacillus]MBY0159925.1 MerR family transcriptional regulator [Cytobacillus firmus]MBU8732655.1 MerR family transcriptional regulator [Cytobacillus oceanisediminis]MBU8767982.1 MerR family transcriptional regulator [Cytobacillus oceanisediminis]MCS0824953.1 MerR family transcriptional regulator [Cytobacillus firmus]MDK7667875.1 MerR family transcriptional regulator [Cytobacillus oceanisediminis]
MGELANIANVSKRTIDYYTSIGLIKAKRSKSNYRIYSEEVLSDLRFIEECKLLHLPLEEIKRKLEMKTKREIQTGEVEKHINAVTLQIKQLHQEIAVLMPLINTLDDEQKHGFSKKLTTESTALLRSLSDLTS